MHRFTRPPKPADFDQKVEARRKLVEKLFQTGKLAAPAKKKARRKAGARVAARRAAVREPAKLEAFDSGVWGAFKPVFAAAQRRKCAFCEGDAAVQQFGDVEHYRPKSAIRHLLNEGRELRDSPKVRERGGPRVGATGYWWLAYDWDNYLLACQICNQQWKSDFFPIVEEPRPHDAPRFGAAETALLLHPFEGPLPQDHLEYNNLGQVTARPGSLHGQATIRTLGLNRVGLQEQRRDIAAAVIDNLERIRQRNVSDETVLALLRELHRLGRDHAPFCGMVRTLIHQKGEPEITWQQIAQTFEP